MGSTKLFLTQAADDHPACYAVRVARGMYMGIDLVQRKNIGWFVGNCKQFKFIGYVPDGVAGGAKSSLSDPQVEAIQNCIKSSTNC